MVVPIKTVRHIEIESDKAVWAVKREFFNNGDGEETERIVRSKWNKKHLKENKKTFKESYEAYEEEYNGLNKTKHILKTKEYKDFKERVTKGDLKDLFNTWAQEVGITKEIEANKLKVKDVDEYLGKKIEKTNKILNDLEDYQKIIQEAENHFNKK